MQRVEAFPGSCMLGANGEPLQILHALIPLRNIRTEHVCLQEEEALMLYIGPSLTALERKTVRFYWNAV